MPIQTRQASVQYLKTTIRNRISPVTIRGMFPEINVYVKSQISQVSSLQISSFSCSEFFLLVFGRFGDFLRGPTQVVISLVLLSVTWASVSSVRWKSFWLRSFISNKSSSRCFLGVFFFLRVGVNMVTAPTSVPCRFLRLDFSSKVIFFEGKVRSGKSEQFLISNYYLNPASYNTMEKHQSLELNQKISLTYFGTQAIKPKRAIRMTKDLNCWINIELIIVVLTNIDQESMLKYWRLLMRQPALQFSKKANSTKFRLGCVLVIPLGIHLTVAPYITQRDRIQTLSFKMKPEPQTPSQEKGFLIPEDVKKMADKNKMILVLDLDETMVYSRREVLPPHANYLLVDIRERQETVLVEIRPYLPQFLKAVSEIFTLYVYTAGTKEYADAVLDAIPNAHHIQRRFYREDCATSRGTLVKKLARIREKEGLGEQKKLVLVDDNKRSIALNRPNSILVAPFEGDQSDERLLAVFSQLIEYYRLQNPQI